MTVVGRRRARPTHPASRAASNDGAARPWGSLSTVSLTCALGLLAVNLAFWAGRAGHEGPWAEGVYWVGQLLIVTPVAARLVSRRPPSSTESVGLVGLLVATEYAVKLCYSPLMWTFPDELEHWRSTEDILRTGRLFTVNYALPVSPGYPGLENVTAALSSITGLSVFVSGTVVVGVAHLLLVALLYAVFHRLSGSTRVAGIGALVYAMTPPFGSFDSMFIYQALALPFLALATCAVLVLTEPRESSERRHRTGWWVALVVSVLTATVTHHVTSYVLAAVLALFTVVTAARSRWAAIHVPALACGLTVAAAAAWIHFAAPTTLDYLAPAFEGLTGHFALTAAGDGASLPAGPLTNQVLILVFIGALAVLLAYGATRLGRAGLRDVGATTFLVASLSFYPVLVLRLVSDDGAERAGRAFTFVFVPVAWVVAVGVVHLIRKPSPGAGARRARGVMAVGLAATMFAGSLASGWPPYWERLPGAYQVGGFERSVSPQGIAAADWALSALGPGNRFGVDFSNSALLGAYGRQDPVRDASTLYYSPVFGPDQRAYAASASVRYLLVDRRLAQSLPVSGSYFAVDPEADHRTEPIPLSSLDKYARMAGVDRLYDSGDIVVYDLNGLLNAQ